MIVMPLKMDGVVVCALRTHEQNEIEPPPCPLAESGSRAAFAAPA
jgi:hypothetical protein